MDILISLDTRRVKKDGTYPILLRLSGNSSTLPISTGYSVTKQHWDEAKREIKKTYKGYSSISRINNILAFRRNAARNVITRLEENGELSSLSIKEVKARIMSEFKRPEAEKIIEGLRQSNIVASENKKKELLGHLNDLASQGQLAVMKEGELSSYFTKQLRAGSVFDFLTKLEHDLKAINKIGNAMVYRCLAGVLENFLGHTDLTFNQVDREFLERWEAWHLKRGLKINSLGTYMRTLRATYNKAAKAGLADKAANPFFDYSIKKEPTAKRAISQKQLLKIINCHLEPEHELFHARNYFLASFAMQGMSFVDMAFLKKSMLYDDRIKYRRTKTSRIYNIKLNAMVQAILEHYATNKEPDEFIFPILKRTTLEEQYQDEKQARKIYNTQLKKLGKLCGIEEKLTSYVSRHSFAMAARLSEVPLEVISQMLGHSDTRTTMIYLDSIPDKTVDDYADKVMSFTTSS